MSTPETEAVEPATSLSHQLVLLWQPRNKHWALGLECPSGRGLATARRPVPRVRHPVGLLLSTTGDV